jgi:nicotinate-nucleotide--dimethylbenzimidazole phosphoribosyltransferase
MRKDLKIGLAIGAVLLVVLIVYLAVPSQNDQLAQNPVGGAGDSAATTEPGASSPSASAPHEEAAKPGVSDTSPAKIEPPKVEQADAGKSASPAEPKEEHASAADKTAADKAKQDPFAVWADALNGGKLPVISETPPSLSAAGGPTNPDTGAPTAAKTTPAEGPIVVVPPTGAGPAEPASVNPTETKPAKAADKSSDKAEAKSADTGDTASATAGRPHKVRSGETYSSIAKLIYGDARYYLAIEKANPNVDPSKLKPGMTINLPDVETVKGAAHPAGDKQKAEPSSSAAGKEKEVDAASEYRVQSGDNLHKIAMKRYGSSTMADRIYELNKATIGDDSAKLKPGMVLKMPPNPNAESQISSTR